MKRVGIVQEQVVSTVSSTGRVSSTVSRQSTRGWSRKSFSTVYGEYSEYSEYSECSEYSEEVKYKRASRKSFQSSGR